MNKKQAKQIIFQHLSRQRGQYFRFLPVDAGRTSALPLVDDVWNVQCFAGEVVTEIRMLFAFQKVCVDILAFPYPCPIEKGCIAEMLKLVNVLNSEVQPLDSSGRFFVDEDDLKVGYSTHIDYNYLNVIPEDIGRYGVLSFLAVTTNASELLYGVGSGEMTAREAQQRLIERFREE